MTDNEPVVFTVEDTLRYMLVRYPTIFPTRAEALEHLFIVNGNGYEWENGCLVSIDGRDLTLTDEVWAKAWEEGTVNQLYNAYAQAQDDLWRKQGHTPLWPLRLNTLPPVDDKELAVRMQDMSLRTDHVYPTCEYAQIANVPDDVRPDWLAAAWQTIDIVLALDYNATYEYGRDMEGHMYHYPISKDIDFIREVVVDLERRGLTRPSTEV